MPGGFGTLDEFFEVLTLVQTQRIPQFPLILFGRDYWSGLLALDENRLEKDKFISPGDLDLVTITDDVDEVIAIILDYERRSARPPYAAEGFAMKLHAPADSRNPNRAHARIARRGTARRTWNCSAAQQSHLIRRPRVIHSSRSIRF